MPFDRRSPNESNAQKNSIEQSPQFVDPQILKYTKFFSDSSVDSMEKFRSYFGFKNYIESIGFEDVFLLLDPNDRRLSFYEKLTIITLLKRLVRSDRCHIEDFLEFLTNLKQKYETTQNSNAFVALYLDQICDFDPETDYDVTYDNTPIRISDRNLMLRDAWGQVLISRSEDFDLLFQLALRSRSYHKNKNYSHDFFAEYERRDESVGDKVLDKHAKFLWRKGIDLKQLAIDEYNFQQLTPELIGLHGIDSEDFEDYLLFFSPQMIVTLSENFGIDFRTLSFQERWYFFNYLKHTTVAEAEIMRIFIQSYGIDAMRSFLATSYDEKAAENIMKIGLHDHQTAQEIFSSYARTLDHNNSFVDSASFLIRLATDRSLDETKRIEVMELVQQLDTDVRNGLIRRAGHLFSATASMIDGAYSGSETPQDVANVYQGIDYTMSLLERLNDGAMMKVQGEKLQGGDASAQTFRFNITDYTSMDEVGLKVSIRPEKNGVDDARVNFEVDVSKLSDEHPLKRSFTQQLSYTGIKGKNVKQKTTSVIRFAFDLDTSSDKPQFTFDTGRGSYDSDELKRTGDTLGRILDVAATHGHHLQDFDEKLSNPENFKQIANLYIAHFNNLMQYHSVSSFGGFMTTADAEPQ